jgi:hypothetical protein
MLPISPRELGLTRSPIVNFPTPLVHALAQTVLRAIDDHLRAKRVSQLADGDSNDRIPDVEKHYFYPIERGIVSDAVLATVIEALKSAGWYHSKLFADHVIIAREPYEVSERRSDRAASVITIPANTPCDEGSASGHHAGGYSAPMAACGS